MFVHFVENIFLVEKKIVSRFTMKVKRKSFETKNTSGSRIDHIHRRIAPYMHAFLEKSHWSLKYRVLDFVATRVFTVVIVEENFETGRKDCRKGNTFFDSGKNYEMAKWNFLWLNACDILA